MAELDTQTKVISKKNEGFPEWLDFDKLRGEGIDYLGELSGNIWTDHNAHDPGITILEVLCYALLDLGYRTSLPAKDLFAKDPDDSSAENNFFTPAAILGCNPLTVTDYRKLLVDVPGVKNAWLIPAEDITIASLCGEQKYRNEREQKTGERINSSNCLNFLNGLYHVYLDVESNIRYKKDVTKVETERTVEHVIGDVKSILMSHRNLCEDFFDITVLCKQKIGICADIELREDADPEKVFVKLIEKLREFLSPAPKFYRLKQLRDKGKSIEEIFEGRPIDLEQSHGFVDVEEFEKIKLQKEIHISDVYNAIFSVEGIVSVKRVKLRNSDGSICQGQNTPWIFKLYKDHVPEFDLLSSGFNLSGNRGNVVMDTGKFAKYLEANPSSNAKALMFPPSANLDVLLEQGNYRKELADYYPIENDFPKVYGIAEGSLPSDVSPQRKAQALQLRGYLLFFDTLLSGYLSQLKNIRNIFALDQANTSDQHTYFINKLSNRPGLEQLVPFGLSDATPHPTTQAFPVCKEELEEIMSSGKIDACNWEKEFTPYKFCSIAERDVAIHQLIEDLKNETFTEYLFTNKSGCWSFYFFTSSEKFAIVGKEFYQQEREARNAMSALRYLCTNESSFRRYTTLDKKKFSFNVVSSIAEYWNYLSLLTENEKLFLQRRNGFLDHLLARFAETFTDYALLSYSFLKGSSLQQNNIQHKEKFLSAYPELSSKRGKSYDYLRNGWNNNNVSGIEKRFESYTGIGLGKQENICHFEVSEFEEQTVVDIKLKDRTIITSNASFQSREEGIEALNLFLKASADPVNYEYSKSTIANQYEISINVGGNLFHYPAGFETEAMANEAGGRLQRVFSLDPAVQDIVPSQFEHTLVLEGKENRWTKRDPVINRQQTFNASTDALANFGDTTQWIPEKEYDLAAAVKFNSNPDKPEELIDINAFEPYENRVDVRKNTTIYKYTVSDRDRNFFFISEKEFEGEALAHENLLRLLFLLAELKHYRVKEVSANEYVLQIFERNQLLATNTIEFQTATEANAAIDGIVAHINRNTYRLLVDTKPVRWKFELKVAIPGSPELLFTSGATEYDNPKEALTEASIIAASRENITVTVNKENELELRRKKDPQKVLALAKISEHVQPQEAQDLTETFLSFKKTIGKIQRETNAPEGQKMVIPDSVSKLGNFGYRLVKKDGYYAWYAVDGDFKNGASKARKITEVFKLYVADEKYLQLIYGDRSVVERKDKSNNTKWYHFRIVTRETDNDPNGIILFESVRGYRSIEEAQKAFDGQHVQILTAAKDESNYGEWISFDEIFSHSSSDCSDSKAHVFIPAETMKLYGHNTDHARQQLVALSSTYPIRSIKKSDPNFADYFLCGEKPKDRDDTCCCDEKEKEFYYFTYKLDGDKNGRWISHEYFTSANEAMRKFNFFLMLLRYKGNYFIRKDECDCRWRLSVREILAESKKRFKTPQEAWGKEGVEKFICTSQSEEAFPLHQREEGCCYSFFVACSNMGLMHPCTYDSSVKRDRALQRLYTASRRLSENKQKKISAEWEKMINVFERTNIQGVRGSWCDRAIELSERFLENGDLRMAGQIDEKSELFDSEKMKRFVHYFPVRRKKLGTSGNEYRYYLHINLPDFHEEKEELLQPCGCEPDMYCCIPWISECCFTTCDEALRYYYDVIECLADKDHYYPVMDCNCNTYGIRFYCGCKEEARQRPDLKNQNRPEIESGQKENNCCGEIVAFNPQCYTSPAMTCEAIDRAKRLINAEGLHLVEHILLRPHCRESDCKCIIDSCLPDTCLEDFKWNLPDDDPCEKDKTYCFVPGADPYSFVATVVLPAWPERFRKKENRQLVEKVLYREMPAHILLRIFWLSPQDVCQFESIYHQWTKWLALKPVCVDYEPACRLIDFLFNYNFHCFECEECAPCAPGAANDPCGFLNDEEADPNAYVNEINNLYCWDTICAPRVEEKYPDKQPKPAYDHVEPIAVIEDTQPVAEIGETEESTEEAERKIDARFAGYRRAINEIQESSGNVNARLAASFIYHVLPDFESYQKVIEAVVANKRLPDNRRLLSLNEKRELVQALTWYYLDRNVLKGRISDNEEELMSLFQKLRKKELLPDYKKWKSSQLTKVEGEAPVHEVKKLFDQL